MANTIAVASRSPSPAADQRRRLGATSRTAQSTSPAARIDVTGGRFKAAGGSIDVTGGLINVVGGLIGVAGDKLDVVGGLFNVASDQLDVAGGQFNVTDRPTAPAGAA